MLHSAGMWITLAVALLSLPLGTADAGPAGDSAASELAGARLIDYVVAIVGRRVITLSQLEAEARIALASHGPVEAAEGVIPDAVLASTLQYVISEDLVEEEAARLGVFPVTAGECQLAEEQLAARFASRQAFEAFLDRFDIDHERLTALLRRRLRASRYLENRLRLQAETTDAEVDALVARAGTDPQLPRARPLAKAYLQRQKYQALAAKLVEELRSRADVRILASFGSPGAEPVPGLAPQEGQSSALLDPPLGGEAP